MRAILFLFVFLLSNNIFAHPDAIHNYTYFGRDREKIDHKGFLENETMEGAQLIYMWRELEPQKDLYDFSEIQKDFEFLRERKKKLWIQLQDSTFSPSRIPVPDYLLKDSTYQGGAVHQYTRHHGEIEGWVARRWDEAVRNRFHKLICRLAKDFDGKIVGINLPETAVGVGEEGNPVPVGFTPEKYRDGIISNMGKLKECFKESVVMQYANFMPGEWLPWEDKSYLRSVFEFGNNNGIALGAPDLMPDHKSYRNHTYKLMMESEKPFIFGIAVQDGNYLGKTNDTSVPKSWPNLVPKLFDFAKNQLRVQYMFWVLQEPYYSKDVLPFFSK